ncbi:GTPase, predicted [Pseudozyma hubeiensis SY62]|uniref:GTPase, predicted n=1 Tax=Pseudozyma hubeiensis (strain SY62) TaxID=1305764 RepID=R9P349_PSEHS|nr:GTPase, predicted [Pseudozyma hubeiensis SY62]GAC95729.1 GTPase, predicted [Pseudozyma hubeiensis SY62]
MGRQQRKEDRQARKKTKISATQSHAKNASGASNAVGKQTSNAGFVFQKNQFASLINKGKARLMQQIQQQQVAAQRKAGLAVGMEVDQGAEASATAAARLKHEIADAAATSNAHTAEADGVDDVDEEDAFLSTSGIQLDPTLTGRRDSSLKAYMRELRKVIDNADVLLEVLDARDPLGCRSFSTEQLLLRSNKKIVLILNKIDLVPKSNVEAWLKYLRHDFPTLAFKASTQSQRNNLAQGALSVHSSGSGESISGGSEAIGAGALLQLIKNYSRSLNLKTSLSVGVFGAPNVGKSSLINSLKRSRVCSVASTPGHTKVLQSIMLDKSIRLIDCPGIVFSDPDHSSSSPEETLIRRQSALLRNVVKVELVEDPITPVEAILARVPREEVLEIYGLDWFEEGDAQDFLMRVAVGRGRMRGGGKLDLEGMARSVLHDWNSGRIKYFTNPPKLHRSAVLTEPKIPGEGVEEEGGALESSSKIVSGFSEAFDLAGLLGEADAEVFGAGTGVGKDLPSAPAPRFAEEVSDEIQDDHEPPITSPTIVEEPEPADTSRRSTLGKRSRLSSSDESDDESDDEFSRHSHLDTIDDDIEPVPSTEPQSEWKDKLHSKATSTSKRTAELSLAFSQQELASMAPLTGAARRKLKKLKKKEARAGAGLVRELEGQKLGEGGDEEGAGKGVGKGMQGMFGNVAVKRQGEVVKRKGTGSMFDVLLEGQDMESEEEQEEEKDVVNGAAGEDYEEEL